MTEPIAPPEDTPTPATDPSPVPDLHPAWAATSTRIDLWMAAFVAALGTLEDVIRGETAKVKSQRTGAEYEYSYAGLVTYFEASRAKLAAQGLAVTQSVSNDDGVVTVWTTVLHVSGQWVTFLPLTFSTSTNPQDVGSAMTYGRRYSHMAALGLASEDDDGQRAKEGAQQRGRQRRNGDREQPSQGPADEPTYTPAQMALRKLWYDEIEATSAPFLQDVRAAFILRWGNSPGNLDDATCEAARPWVATVALAMPGGWDAVKAVIAKLSPAPEPDATQEAPGSPQDGAAAPDEGVVAEGPAETPADDEMGGTQGDAPAPEAEAAAAPADEAAGKAVPARGRSRG